KKGSWSRTDTGGQQLSKSRTQPRTPPSDGPVSRPAGEISPPAKMPPGSTVKVGSGAFPDLPSHGRGDAAPEGDAKHRLSTSSNAVREFLENSHGSLHPKTLPEDAEHEARPPSQNVYLSGSSVQNADLAKAVQGGGIADVTLDRTQVDGAGLAALKNL